MLQAQAHALASLRSQAPVFPEYRIWFFFSAMSASRTSQAASIFYLDNLWRLLLHYIPVPACCFGYFFLHRNFLQSLFSGFVVFNSFLKAVGEDLHSLFYISFPEFAGTSTNSTVASWVSLCLVSVALFSCLQFQPIFYFIGIFSTHIFLDISQFTPRRRQRGEVFHNKSYFSLSSFAGMYTIPHHSGEFLLSSLRFNFRGPGQDKIFLLATSTPLPCS